MSNGSASEKQDRGRAQDGRLGRRVGITLVWLSLCFVIGMSSLSIIPSLFWPEHAPHPPAVPAEICARTIHQLDQELRDDAAARVRGEPRMKLGVWLSAWDGRYLALAGGCGPLEGASKNLYKLRNQIEALLQRYEREAGKTQRRIENALEPIGGSLILPRTGAGEQPTRSKG